MDGQNQVTGKAWLVNINNSGSSLQYVGNKQVMWKYMFFRSTLPTSFENEPLTTLAGDIEKVDATHALFLHVYGILLRHKLVLSLPALRILEEKLCEDGRKINDPNYELYHKDMLLDKSVMFHEYDPKNKKIRGRYIPKLPKKNIRRTLPRSRQDLKR